MKKTYCGIHQTRGLQFLILALFIVLIGSSTAAYGQDVSTSFEFFDTSGSFTLGTSPKSVTFTNGLAQTVGQRPLYHSGDFSFMVTQGNTATITFETPAASVTLWLRDQSSTSVLTVFDQNSQVISTVNATAANWTEVPIVAECGKGVGSITLQNNGTGFAVIDDFSFTAGQASSGESTTLIANFLNGNSDVNNSRVYLWNPSASAGEVCVRAFALPLTSGTAQELTPAPLSLGTLETRSALNVKVAEDILDPLGRRPYTDDDGDLTLEFTIHAANVKGAAQVFNNSLTLAFGTYTLQEIPTSNVSPTVLVANFSNGNDTALASRVYLWNPSTSAGNVMVRVYTLGRGEASTLLGEVNLGDIEAGSARNIKVAEDILEELGRRPHEDNGGNLTLEFTIDAANVLGAAQVFNNSQTLALGVYPLQEVPTSNVMPTVLVANFMNGNDASLASRVYLWNPTDIAGNVTARVYTLGRGEASTLLGEVNLGDIEARSARNIKVAEDILAHPALGIPLPYEANGGNLTLEFTIDAANVLGAAQVFNNSLTLAFGTYPLQQIPTSNVIPTVLVANFMNGNDASLASRVYLWNPTDIAGNVTARVYTLEPTGSSTQLGEVDLGDIEARSARNIKLAEDLLEELGRRPHTDNGGNLMLEFTIQAANVLGAAQVFNNSLTLAFGTYPMQDPPDPGAGESTSNPNPGPGPDPDPDPGPDPFDEEGY